jgi:hypothetical protein
LACPLLPTTMNAHTLALRRGKNGDVQSFSLARPFDPAVAGVIQDTIGPGVNSDYRLQVLSDPGKVHQFACSFLGGFGFFTHPTITTNSTGAVVVVGSFADTLGEPAPCSIPLADFHGHFTTLVRREDAATFGLAVHPVLPDTVEGRPV